MRLDILVEDMLALYTPRCEALALQISRRVTFRKPIHADPDLLGQVVENLLKNAIEAQPRGGFLHVEVDSQDQNACFRVKNQGFSLNLEEADRILEPYFTTKADGTGLGLTIARRIVEAHGGYMSARITEPGVLEVSVCLPATGATEMRASKQRGDKEVAL